MKRAKLLPVFFVAFLAAIGSSQEAVQRSSQEGVTSLGRARSLFAKADVDKNARVTLREAQAAGHSIATFRKFDENGDGALTQEEFLAGYAQQIAERGERIDRDYTNEVARIHAARRKNAAGATDAENEAARIQAARRENAAGADDAENEAARIQAARRENAAGAGDADPVRTAAPNAGRPARVEEAGNADTARSRAANALSRIREQRSPQRTENAGGDEIASNGPAARRVSADSEVRNPETLRRVLLDRRRQAAEQSREDPRVEEARDRVLERDRSRAGAAERGRASARDAGDVRDARGGARANGPARGRTGSAGTTRRVGTRGGS